MRAERAAKSEKKSSKKGKKVEGNQKEANKKEHCLLASRVFDSALIKCGYILANRIKYYLSRKKRMSLRKNDLKHIDFPLFLIMI